MERKWTPVDRKVASRRVNKKSQLLTQIAAEHKCPMRNRFELLQWLGDHTTGRFFIDVNTVFFEKEEDAIMFKLGFKI